ncbi:unnamed protein product [Mycena citricolor]|uniref:Uncharacterized protein n=1 Tax=Mycena citricolor TaxID=2018698 RepID=A0AAD2JXE7_9AGAR|nr:unnamed protein product [Mycena citricolor]CAK5273674.1 unnamed protein product [Mycena citricolor]
MSVSRHDNDHLSLFFSLLFLNSIAMARLSAFFALFVASSTMAAPLFGLSGCGLDRFNIVTTLAETGVSVANINTADPATAASVKTAQAGLTSASAGIAQIALALITGGTPPAAARTQVQKGLTDAQTALSGINDPTVNQTLADAQSKLAAAIQDGNDVVADCN